MGVAAGGDLAASSATLFDQPVGPDHDPLRAVSARPNFMILLNPMITRLDAHAGAREGPPGTSPGDENSLQLSLERQVTPATPPAFIVTTPQEKNLEAQNSALFFQALQQAGVACELHVFEEREPGFAAHDLAGPKGSWPQQAEKWLVHGGFLPTLPRD